MKQYYQTPKGKASDATTDSNQPNPVVETETKKSPVPLKKMEPVDTVVETTKPKTKTVNTFKPKVKQQSTKNETTSDEKTGIDAALDGLE